MTRIFYYFSQYLWQSGILLAHGDLDGIFEVEKNIPTEEEMENLEVRNCIYNGFNFIALGFIDISSSKGSYFYVILLLKLLWVKKRVCILISWVYALSMRLPRMEIYLLWITQKARSVKDMWAFSLVNLATRKWDCQSICLVRWLVGFGGADYLLEANPDSTSGNARDEQNEILEKLSVAAVDWTSRAF